MSTDGVSSSILGQGAPSSQATTSKASLAKNFDTFLNMLTTQLKNQDPLSPMDSTQFTNQLVQFANVEQGINMNANMEKLIGVNKTNLTAQAISYIGHVVEVPGGDLPLQDGKGDFSYYLGGEARTAMVVIKSADGTIINSIPGATSAGRHEMSWDGKDANGKQLEDGHYIIEVVANDAEGNTVKNGVNCYGRVTDVASDPSGTLVAMGKVVTTVDDILTVREKPAVKN